MSNDAQEILDKLLEGGYFSLSNSKKTKIRNQLAEEYKVDPVWIKDVVINQYGKQGRRIDNAKILELTCLDPEQAVVEKYSEDPAEGVILINDTEKRIHFVSAAPDRIGIGAHKLHEATKGTSDIGLIIINNGNEGAIADSEYRKLEEFAQELKLLSAAVHRDGISHTAPLTAIANASSIDTDLEAIVDSFAKAILEEQCGISVNTSFLCRFSTSLLAKRFVILTGLSGSGKTKLGQAFAYWISENKGFYRIVPVGADWTSREQMLGYHDGINPDRYIKQAALKLILEAISNPDSPHFLILDEMNLSHVERYFSDFLSAIESGDEISMHEVGGDVDGVPGRIDIPDNLYVIGTVNVDETTYMFSPKVLDRANVIEFRVAVDSFTEFLDDPKRIELDSIAGNGAAYGPALVSASLMDIDRAALESITEELTDGSDAACYPSLRLELEVLFRIFQQNSWDFGFRVGKEVSRFVYFHRRLSGDDWKLADALDAQIIQKLMPKLNGPESRLSNILKALAWYCSGREEELHEDNTIEGKTPEVRAEAIIKKVEDSTADDPKRIYQNLLSADKKGKYPLSMEKTFRMWNAVKINGFTSFAEN